MSIKLYLSKLQLDLQVKFHKDTLGRLLFFRFYIAPF